MPDQTDDKKKEVEARLDYYEIPVNIFRLQDKVEEDIYTYHMGNYVLHKSRGGTWGKDDVRLPELGIDKIFLRYANYTQFQNFLSRRTSKILTNPNVPLQEKASALQDIATPILGGVYKTQASTESIQGAADYVKNCITFLNERGGLPSIVELSSKALDEFGHSLHTSAYAVALAKISGYGSQRELHTIGLGALFHDIGKSSIDEEILNKPGELSPGEWEIMRQHPEMGEKILDNKSIVPVLSKKIVLEHHERANGKGYPRGIKNTHLFSKIVSIADVFGSLISERPYRQACTPYEALRIMVTEMKGEFDDQLIRHFIELLGR